MIEPVSSGSAESKVQIAAGDFDMHSVSRSYSWHGPAAMIGIAAALLIALWKSDTIGSILGQLGAWIACRKGWLCTVICIQCVVVAGMFFFDWAFQQEAPPVVYMAF
jgi:hypothetical protein